MGQWFGCAVLLGVAPALAQTVPGRLSYGGELYDDGVVYQGSATMLFEIYDQESAGLTLWQELFLSVPVVNGRFGVELGGTPGAELDKGLFDGRPLWLQVTVNGAPLLPRTPVLTMPYAFRADEATSLEGLNAADFAKVGDLATPGSASVEWANLLSVPADLADGDNDTRPNVSCGADILTWDGAQFLCVPDADTFPGITCTGNSALTWDGTQFGCLDVVAAVGPHTTSLDWTAVTNRPAGLDDGDQDTKPGADCPAGQVLFWSGGVFSCVAVNYADIVGAPAPGAGGATMSYVADSF